MAGTTLHNHTAPVRSRKLNRITSKKKSGPPRAAPITQETNCSHLDIRACVAQLGKVPELIRGIPREQKQAAQL